VSPRSARTVRSPSVFDAHDFVWKQRRTPYDLVVYQLGNASCHGYMWAYLARYPGLVVLHDPRLHQARAQQLLRSGRFADYRHEFWYDHPDAVRDFVEYAVEGLGGPIYYAWSMIRVVVRTARLIAVHNARVAADLREEFPDARVETIRLGTPAPAADPAARARTRAELGVGERAVLFAAFGKITAEKRIGAIVRAFSALAAEGADVHLLLSGDASDYLALAQDFAESAAAERVHLTGYLPDAAVSDYLAAADACLCLRWPTALETSASWIRCLAASRPTVVTSLPHLADVPRDVALRVDVLNEQATLDEAVRRLAREPALRDRLARAGHAYWAAHHTLDHMAEDYRRVLASAAARPVPAATGLPAHVVDDYSGRADAIARELGVAPDVLEPFRR